MRPPKGSPTKTRCQRLYSSSIPAFSNVSTFHFRVDVDYRPRRSRAASVPANRRRTLKSNRTEGRVVKEGKGRRRAVGRWNRGTQKPTHRLGTARPKLADVMQVMFPPRSAPCSSLRLALWRPVDVCLSHTFADRACPYTLRPPLHDRGLH